LSVAVGIIGGSVVSVKIPLSRNPAEGSSCVIPRSNCMGLYDGCTSKVLAELLVNGDVGTVPVWMIGKDVTVPVSMTSEDGRVPLIKTGEDGTLPPSVSAEGFTSKAGNE